MRCCWWHQNEETGRLFCEGDSERRKELFAGIKMIYRTKTRARYIHNIMAPLLVVRSDESTDLVERARVSLRIAVIVPRETVTYQLDQFITERDTIRVLFV